MTRVERIQLWRGEVEDRPGALAGVLKSAARSDVIMGYSYPGEGLRKAILELYPVTPPVANLAQSPKPTLLVTGDDRLGLREELYRALADAGINMDFLVALAIGEQYALVVGFKTDDEADRAAEIMRRLDA